MSKTTLEEISLMDLVIIDELIEQSKLEKIGLLEPMIIDEMETANNETVSLPKQKQP